MSDPMTEMRYEQLELALEEPQPFQRNYSDRIKATTLYKVQEDLYNRQQKGIQTYGHTLDKSNDDMLQHLYEELLDACMYIRRLIDQRNQEK